MYVLYHQDYDDFQIYGVFQSREGAEQRIRDYGGQLHPDGSYHIEYTEAFE